MGWTYGKNGRGKVDEEGLTAGIGANLTQDYRDKEESNNNSSMCRLCIFTRLAKCIYSNLPTFKLMKTIIIKMMLKIMLPLIAFSPSRTRNIITTQIITVTTG